MGRKQRDEEDPYAAAEADPDAVLAAFTRPAGRAPAPARAKRTNQVAQVKDLRPAKRAPTGRVRLDVAPPPEAVREAGPAEYDVTTTQHLFMVSKEGDQRTVHVLVRAETRTGAVRLANVSGDVEVTEIFLDGRTEVAWECSIEHGDGDL